MTYESGPARGARPSDAVLLVAGLADLAVSAVSSAVGEVRGLLGRADVAELAEEGQRDLRARGRLALDRCATIPPAHLEVLARHTVARRGDDA
ncbi:MULTISPECIES: polyprenyl synthetase [unclassified Streptomyces]|uniref:polyprenyl synthetase n=1 Tax=unclassified Streptomyces TaxID=2593676 RepID=UPI003827D2B0